MGELEALVTLWPEMPHYKYFAHDSRVHGIRLNTAMADPKTLPGLLKLAVETSDTPLYFDVKGRQLRVTSVVPRKDRLECYLNHPISVETPTPVLFKAGADGALLERVEDVGYRLVFRGGPQYNVIPGESLHIRHPSLSVGGELFPWPQKEFLKMAKDAGISRYMLSYVGSQAEVDEMREHVGDDLIVCKIEDRKGLDFVAKEYVKAPNLGLLTARGDLFVEVQRPHDILHATRQIVQKDPDAILGSRILLSVTNETVPSCADMGELGWLFDQGYRRLMFCDSLCLKREPLDRALNILNAVYESYVGGVRPEEIPVHVRPALEPKDPLRFFSVKRAIDSLWGAE